MATPASGTSAPSPSKDAKIEANSSSSAPATGVDAKVAKNDTADSSKDSGGYMFPILMFLTTAPLINL